MRIIIEDAEAVKNAGTGLDDVLEKVRELLSDDRHAWDEVYIRIEAVEVNLKKMYERMNSEERSMEQWDSIEKIEAYLKEIDQRLKKFESVPSIDETPDLHTDL